jgi:hypothetical protein
MKEQKAKIKIKENYIYYLFKHLLSIFFLFALSIFIPASEERRGRLRT